MKMPEKHDLGWPPFAAKEQGIGATCVCNGVLAADIMAVRLQKIVIDATICVSVMLLRSMQNNNEVADAKAENDALRDDVAAGRRRLHIKAVCQSVREATTASGVDNAASPDWQTPLNGSLLHLREADHYAKTTGRNPEVY
ncbi:hypothetical protein HAX54_000311 [Datura stramonium]|uniref:Uncharacterized protein n=1 Tax=Datura stramonium TaxID=4076 RepID=A0ABS8WSI8_DATST|nr:hypothetical protein [Datura stramonium]